VNSMVKCARIVLLVLLVALPGAAAAGCISSECGESKVDWASSLDEALAMARSDNKAVMIDFYADWCQPCKKMDCETYTDEELGAFVNENFAPLKVNVDRSSLGSDYNVEYLPTILFLSPDGTQIGQAKQYWIVGYRSAEALRGGLQAALDARAS
jgi:thiol:disulfide interchange protein